jgi:hypothetical protein
MWWSRHSLTLHLVFSKSRLGACLQTGSRDNEALFAGSNRSKQTPSLRPDRQPEESGSSTIGFWRGESDVAQACHGPRPGSVFNPLPAAGVQFDRVGRTIRPEKDVLQEVTPFSVALLVSPLIRAIALFTLREAGATPPLFLDESPLRRRRPSQFGTNRSATRRPRAPEPGRRKFAPAPDDSTSASDGRESKAGTKEFSERGLGSGRHGSFRPLTRPER